MCAEGINVIYEYTVEFKSTLVIFIFFSLFLLCSIPTSPGEPRIFLKQKLMRYDSPIFSLNMKKVS